MRFLFKTRYAQDLQWFEHDGQRFWYGLLMLALVIAPFALPGYLLSQLVFIFIYAIVGLGLMLLAGYTGQMSIGHAAFMAVGAYTEGALAARGWPFLLSLPCAALATMAAGVVVGLPALRLKGIYLSIATLAFGFIIEEVITRWDSVTGGSAGMRVAPVEIFGLSLRSGEAFYALCGLLMLAALWLMRNLLRTPAGRAFIAIRDSEISAQSMGIHLARFKTMSFALSAAFAGVGGALYAHKISFLSPEQFTVAQSIELLMMIVIGGLGSLHGVFFGAIFMIVLPQLIAASKDLLPAAIAGSAGLQPLTFGLILLGFLLLEPMGLYGRWLKVRTYLELFPYYRRNMFERQRSYQKSERVK
jgi:branched-chain amino acid transport system permease protein